MQNTENLKIKMLSEIDQEEYFLHCQRAIKSGGKNGAPPYTPLGQETSFSKTEKIEIVNGWKIPATQTNWNRVWGAFLEGKIVGSIMLKGASYKTKNHRAHLSLGIDDHNLRGKGVGTLLMDMALSWAKSQKSIKWIDLSVFDTNPRATALYKKFEFKEYGHLQDHFRIEGKSFNHILMTLPIG